MGGSHRWLGLVAGLLLFAPEALALMPPHVDRTVPAHGETLEGEVLVFHGYSLAYGEPSDVAVTDLTTSAAVELSTELDCQWEGEDPPGHVGGTQQRCELRVTLKGLESGHRYRAVYLDTELEFDWAGPAQPVPEAPPPVGDEPAEVPEPSPVTTD